MRKKGLLLVALAFVLCVGCQKAEEEKKEGLHKADNSVERQEDGYSPILSEKEIDEENEYPYEIKVNRKQNCITVYGVDDTGKYIIPIRAMICSVGEDTPTGTFQLGETSRWQMETNGDFSQYATRIVDDVAFHSAPYYSQNNQDLNVEQFNKMGQDVSGSSIQMEVADAKWIAGNCPAGTKVEIYEDKEEGPLGKPQARVLEEDEKKDPTDAEKNTKKSKNYVPVVFDGIEDKVIGVFQGCDLLAGVSAQDSDKQDLTARIQVFGDVDVTTPGTYEIIYMCENEDEESRAVKCNVQVTKDVSATNVVTEEAAQPTTTTTPAQGTNQNTSTVGQGNSGTGAEDADDKVVFVNPNLLPDSTPTPEPTPTPQPTPAPTKTPSSTSQNSQVTPSVQTYYNDIQSPLIEIIASTRYVANVDEQTLSNRIRVTDDSGSIAGIYITVQPLKQQSYYVIIYEAEDAAGNKTCVSETVQMLEQTVFR